MPPRDSTPPAKLADDEDIVVALPSEHDALLPKEDPPRDPESQARVPGVKLTVIIPAMIGVMLSAMDNTIVISSYSAIGSDLRELNRTSWIATSYMLTTSSFQPLYGKVSDIFGRKASLLFAYVVFGIGCLGCGLARSLGELVAARALAGIGGGGMTTVVTILMSDIIPLRSRGTYQGLVNIIFAFGSAVGAPLGGMLSDSIGWRWAFLLQVPPTLLAIVAVSLFLHVPHPVSASAPSASVKDRLKRVDFLGAFVLVSAVLLLLVGLDRGGNLSITDPFVLGAFGGSLALFILFAVVEKYVAAEPFAPPHIVMEHTILACSLANFFSFAGYMGVIFYVPLYYQAVAGYSAGEAGLRLLPAIVGAVSGSLAGGIIMQRTGRYYWLTFGAYSLCVVGAVALFLCSGIATRSVPAMVVALSALSCGNGLGVTSTLIGLISAAGPEDQAVATAVSYLFRSLGTVSGVSVSSMLVQGALRRKLHEVLTGDDADEIVRRVRESLDVLKHLPPATARIVVACYEQAVHSAFVLGIGLTICAVLASAFIREKKLPK